MELENTAAAYPIEYVEKPEEGAWGIIGRSLMQYNRQQAGEEHPARICFVVKDPQGTIVGGIMAEAFYEWLNIELLWIREDLRGLDYGTRLMDLAEEEGRKNGAKHAFLDTFSFQAPEFYKRRGYTLFGELADFPPGHRRYFFTREL